MPRFCHQFAFWMGKKLGAKFVSFWRFALTDGGEYDLEFTNTVKTFMHIYVSTS